MAENIGIHIKIDGDGSNAGKAISGIDKQLSTLGTNAVKFQQNLDNISRNSAIAFAGLSAATGGFLKTAGNFEQWTIAFEVMLGDAEKAKTLMSDLADFAKTTPFQLTEVTSLTKQLLAYNIAQEDVLDTMTALGDIAAGVGKEKLPFLTLAYGQVAAKGRLYAQEIRQFTEAGVPLIATLADQFNVTENQMFKLVERGKVGFSDVQKAIFSLSGEGGKFFNLMARQSGTFLGLISNIQDSITITSKTIGDAILPKAKEFAKGFLDMLEKINYADPKTIALIAEGIVKVTLALGGLAIATKSMSLAIAAFEGLAKLRLLALALTPSLPLIIGVGTALFVAGVAIKDFIEANGGLIKSFEKLKYWAGLVGITLEQQLTQGFEKGVLAVTNLYLKLKAGAYNIADLFIALWGSIKKVFLDKIIERFKLVGEIIKNLFNHDFSGLKDAVKNYYDAADNAKNASKIIEEEFTKAFSSAGKRSDEMRDKITQNNNEYLEKVRASNAKIEEYQKKAAESAIELQKENSKIEEKIDKDRIENLKNSYEEIFKLGGSFVKDFEGSLSSVVEDFFTNPASGLGKAFQGFLKDEKNPLAKKVREYFGSTSTFIAGGVGQVIASGIGSIIGMFFDGGKGRSIKEIVESSMAEMVRNVNRTLDDIQGQRTTFEKQIDILEALKKTQGGEGVVGSQYLANLGLQAGTTIDEGLVQILSRIKGTNSEELSVLQGQVDETQNIINAIQEAYNLLKSNTKLRYGNGDTKEQARFDQRLKDILDIVPKDIAIKISEGRGFNFIEKTLEEFQNILSDQLSNISSQSEFTLSELLDNIQLEQQIADLLGTAPQFATGALNIPRDMLSVVHQGEMIIPSEFASALRAGQLSLSGGGTQNKGSSMMVTNNITIQGGEKSAMQLYQELQPYINGDSIRNDQGSFSGVFRG